MRLKPFVFLFVAVAVSSACSKSRKSEGITIPDDIPFNEKALPPVGDADFARAKLVAQTAGDAADPMSQILIKNDETAFDQREREDKFNKMRPEVQALVRRWQADCKPNHRKTGKGIEGIPQPGQVFTSTDLNESIGAQCPVQMAERMASTITVEAFTQTPLNFVFNISASGNAIGAYNDAAQQQIMGATNFEMHFTMNGRHERSGESGRAFSRMDGNGKMEALNFGTLKMEMTTENLERTEAEKTLTTTRITENGKTFVFTQFWNQTNKIAAVPRFFIGNRELTLDEVKAMGEFPFTPNENKAH